ncbi:hypothetical protein [Mycobacterium hubeiense]|uniref:hypothetical protein n=1 Tax=Mycobacterium hubeiense TaxID=1867256 RepID=UPI000C7F21EB|nr:hypothetical protein [Mycobacterium sp. QGD 101]
MSATVDRQELVRLAEEAGWRHQADDRVDVYVRGNARVRVIWRGDDVINGGSLFHDDIMTTYTRDFAAINRWLTAK